jgi:hypothetical protein
MAGISEYLFLIGFCSFACFIAFIVMSNRESSEHSGRRSSRRHRHHSSSRHDQSVSNALYYSSRVPSWDDIKVENSHGLALQSSSRRLPIVQSRNATFKSRDGAHSLTVRSNGDGSTDGTNPPGLGEPDLKVWL